MRSVVGDLTRRAAVVLGAPAIVATIVSFGSGASSAPPIYPPDANWTDATLPDVKLIVDANLDVAFADAKTPAKDAKIDAPLDVSPPPIPPDPTPLVCDTVFVLGVQWNKGVVTIERARREKLPKKMQLPHHMGRFAVELYVGPTLLDRDRFDVPLLGDDGPASDPFGKGLVTIVDVRVPESDRPTRLVIWDRATDKRWTFDYPPKLSP